VAFKVIAMSTNFGSIFGNGLLVKPKIFVSYHHGLDQIYYDSLFADQTYGYKFMHDNSLERKIQSENNEYIMRRIRDEYLTGTSCTIVLCGLQTAQRKFVDWEIDATLEKQHALVGLWLPTLPLIGNGTEKPARLQDNLDSGYAVWAKYNDVVADHSKLVTLVHEARSRSKKLIKNDRPRKYRNG
jgi:MTH538 TIR-like domain (DUF1863)